MKPLFLFFVLFPVFSGIAQEEKKKIPAAIKPSTTDCPTWNKKDKKSSKAEYFQYLRSSKTKTNQQTTYNPHSNRDLKAQPTTVSQKPENPNQKKNAEQNPIVANTEKAKPEKAKKTEKDSPVFSKKNNSATSSTEEKPAASTVVPSEEKKADKSGADETKTNETKTEIKDKKTEDSKLKKKLERMSRKSTKVRRHSNSKCPSF